MAKKSMDEVKHLIDLGKEKGFLTYDEVNDLLPPDIVSSDQIDDWLSTLGDEGIEVVDSATSVKVHSGAATGPKVPEILSPILNVVPMQLFAYFVADLRGLDALLG